ncbi:MAG: hypothetical protein CM15mP49_13580 [Actinomycetota bacterium]|nr:MAG: hypothetical protein CM15mP49_13580 [Actinomycetota bacterium]
MNEALLRVADETLTTALLVQIAGKSVIEINRPIGASGWIDGRFTKHRRGGKRSWPSV